MQGLAEHKTFSSKKKWIWSFTLVCMIVVSGFMVIFIQWDNTFVSATDYDYTGFTEAEMGGNDNITVHDSSHASLYVNKTSTSHLYKDEGVDAISGNFYFYMETILHSDTENNALAYIWAVSDKTDDVQTTREDNSENILYIFFGKESDGDVRMRVSSNVSGDDSSDTLATGLSTNTRYYLNISRVSDDLILNIFTDADRTSEIAGSPLEASGAATDSFRYLTALSGHYGDGDEICNVSVYNLTDTPPTGGGEPYIDESAFTSSLSYVGGQYCVTFDGDPGGVKWCNSSGTDDETMDVYIRDGDSDVDWVNVSLWDVSSQSYTIDAEDFGLAVSVNLFPDDEWHDLGNFPVNGGNITLDADVWIWTYDPFPITGDDHLYYRFYVDTTGYAADIYNAEAYACEVYIGEYT